MPAPTCTPIDYTAYIQKARVLRAQAMGAALADLRAWLRALLRAGGWVRQPSTR